MKKNYVVILGRPNVGKSTLFNRLIGKRKALVHPKPGTTRDRNEETVYWHGKEFVLIDTGGWEESNDNISMEIKKQLYNAINYSDVVILVTDGKEGVHPIDTEIANFIRTTGKNIILVVNKVDSPKDEPKISDFYRLGIKKIIHISAIHGININTLLDEIISIIQVSNNDKNIKKDDIIKIILVGKPNVGKSSLTNSILKEERTIVTPIPGTTREAIDIKFEYLGKNFVIIDTPGLHKKRIFKNDLEYISNLSTRHALERANIAILIIDATQGIGETETKIAALILEHNLGCLIAVNKWDLINRKEEATKLFKEAMEQKFQFLWWSKVIYISAKTGQRVCNILPEILNIYDNYKKMISKEDLSQVLTDSLLRNPFSRHGKRLRIMDIQQIGIKPPRFLVTVNNTQIIHFSHQRFIENTLRERFDFLGTPIILKFREKHTKIYE